MDAQGRKDFGEYIKSLRAKAGLTQKQASESAKVSVPYLAQTERGERNPPSRRVLAKLAEAYAVSAETLLEKAERAEGLVAEPDENQSRVEWAYQAVLNDPKFAFGNRSFGEQLDFKTKAAIVRFYEGATGRKLFSEAEEQTVHEYITGQGSFNFDDDKPENAPDKRAAE